MVKPISNHYRPGMARPKLTVSTRVALEPSEDWSYAHHPFLTRFGDGYFLCSSQGHLHEDDVGQRVVYMTSADLAHWEPARVLAEPADPAHEALIPQGLYVRGDTLIAYYLRLRYREDVLKNGVRQMGSRGRTIEGWYCRTTRDGLRWSEERALPAFGGNMMVRRLRSGRLFSCGGRQQAYSDCEDGVSGWRGVEVCPEGYGNAPEDVRGEDDLPGLVSDTHVSLCEGSFIQQDSGRIWLYLRSATPRLWACYSDDEGESWTLPQPTDFTDNRTKFCMGRLPNGLYYYVGTPDPFPPRTRHVLALSLSRDGLDWTEHYLLADEQYKGRYPGIDKNGVYAYPTVLVEGEKMHIAVSINKEMIVVMTTDWTKLQRRSDEG